MAKILTEKEIDALLEIIEVDDNDDQYNKVNNDSQYNKAINYLKNNCIITGKGLNNIAVEYKHKEFIKQIQILEENMHMQTMDLIKYRLLNQFLINYKNKLKEIFTDKFEESITIIDSDHEKDIDKYLISRYEDKFISIKFSIDPAFIYKRTQIDHDQKFFEYIMKPLFEYLDNYKNKLEAELSQKIPTTGYHFPSKITKKLLINDHQFKIDIYY